MTTLLSPPCLIDRSISLALQKRLLQQLSREKTLVRQLTQYGNVGSKGRRLDEFG